MKKHTPAAITGAATIALAGVAALTFAPSQAAPSDNSPRQHAATSAKTARIAAPIACNGGASKSLTTRLNATPFSFAGTSNADVQVPGASVALVGPARGTDTYLVTFSAETYYTGTGWLGLEVHKDGVPIAPFANNGSPYAFASEPNYQGNSAQFCTRIGRGIHRLAVKASTTGGAGESGWLDDWTMSVQRFE
jgi:hypothetical protein